MMMLYMVEKKLDDIFSHLDTIHERNVRTDRQTDTGRRAYATRGAAKIRPV